MGGVADSGILREKSIGKKRRAPCRAHHALVHIELTMYVQM
jgi:hypothetical protein